MGFLNKLFSAPGRAYRWLTQDEAGLRRDKSDAAADYQDMQREANPYSAWEELDDMRGNLLFGSWALRRFRSMGKGGFGREKEALAREKAAAEGREYKSKLQLELEAAARKREEAEMRRAEKKRLKEEERRRKA